MVPVRSPRVMSRREAERLARRVRAAHERLAPLLPDIDPGDLGLILEAIFRPRGSGRRFFLYPLDSEHHVF